MGASDQTLPFFTQFFQLQARFFVVAMAIVAGYLVLSLPLSIVCIVRPHAVGPRLLLLVLDTLLAHNSNPNTNWLAICQQFGDFCQRVSGAVVAAFVSVVSLVTLAVVSVNALHRV